MSDEFHYHVYVIELDLAVKNDVRFINENPNMQKGYPCYYVGITGLTPQQRFVNHKSGNKASRIVKKYGIQLVPELYQQFNPMSYELATRLEVIFAKILREKGCGVWQK
ncbi:MAG: hypothetical protein A2Z15_06525 [Chloroflexi bacterium RBG_16_50_11]|nr:MAG: hypothetical protein A2Z15_06525 [Chloroflexi bacterium RBG_16_50_11]